MMLSLATRSYLANKREADYGVCVYIYSNVKYIYIYIYIYITIVNLPPI
jgi:hypothetical protein